ncbi:MAG: hypothetical protein U5L03_13300 [Burkholderiaceae bacterium]|nr:hypothetical protein [Burkholderiaceae bacterium]
MVTDALGLAPAIPLIIGRRHQRQGLDLRLCWKPSCGAAGYRVGLYTSPHLLRYNERIRINGREPMTPSWSRAFDRVEAARGDASLTYFEFGTLAAMDAVRRGRRGCRRPRGRAGRAARCGQCLSMPTAPIVTSVALDHMEWLGDTREQIGFEKAGIFRAGRPAICGDPTRRQA